MVGDVRLERDTSSSYAAGRCQRLERSKRWVEMVSWFEDDMGRRAGRWSIQRWAARSLCDGFARLGSHCEPFYCLRLIAAGTAIWMEFRLVFTGFLQLKKNTQKNAILHDFEILAPGLCAARLEV